MTLRRNVISAYSSNAKHLECQASRMHCIDLRSANNLRASHWRFESLLLPGQYSTAVHTTLNMRHGSLLTLREKQVRLTTSRTNIHNPPTWAGYHSAPADQRIAASRRPRGAHSSLHQDPIASSATQHATPSSSVSTRTMYWIV